jgi:hypothetical protein
MQKKLFSLLFTFFIISFTSFSQKTIKVKNNGFETLYSQPLEESLWIRKDL